MDDGRWTMDDGLGTLRRWTVDGGGIRGCSHFVTNANTGDKAVTKRILRVDRALFVTGLVTKWGPVPLMM